MDLRQEIALDGVTTFNEFAVPLVARLAERLGLPGGQGFIKHRQKPSLAGTAGKLSSTTHTCRCLAYALAESKPHLGTHCLVRVELDIMFLSCLYVLKDSIC